MAKNKRQRKFEAKHLQSTIKRRKHLQHIKRKKNAAVADEPEEPVQDKNIEDLDVDEFLSGDFLNNNEVASSEEEEELASESDDGDELVGSEEDDDADMDEVEIADEDEEEEESDDDQTTRKLKSEVSSHKAQLEALKKQDPEFYKYLQEADKDLLAFGSDEEEELGEEEEEEEELEEEEEEEELPEESEPQPKAHTLTLAQVESWTKSVRETGSLRSLKRLCVAYRAATRYGDGESNKGGDDLRMASSALYNHIMLFMLREADGVFKNILGIELGAPVDAKLRPAALVKLQSWTKVAPMIKSYLGNTTHLFSFLTDAGMLAFILRRLRASTAFLCASPKLVRAALKAAFGLFSSDNVPLRVQAVLLVRGIAMASSAALECSPAGTPAEESATTILDSCLRGSVRAFTNGAGAVNAASMPIIDFMAAAVDELYSAASPANAYQHAYEAVRVMAGKLRSALDTKTKDAYREVYCWRFINSLELWTRVVASAATKERSTNKTQSSTSASLTALAYPLSQLLIGTATLLPSPGYFPLRLRCARALCALGASTGTFVPAAATLVEILSWPELTKRRSASKAGPTRGKGGAGAGFDAVLTLRAGKSLLQEPRFQEELLETTFELLALHLSQWACHVAFPELAHITQLALRRFVKACGAETSRRSGRMLLDAIDRNVVFVGRARDNAEFSPKDAQAVAGFLAAEASAGSAPLQQYARLLAEKARQRAALRRSEDVLIGRRDSNKKEHEDESGSDEDDAETNVPEPTAILVPDSKVQNKKASKETETAMEEAEEDIVNTYALSSSDEEDDNEDDNEPSDDDGSAQANGRHGADKHRPSQARDHSGGRNPARRGGRGGARGGRGRGGRGRGRR